MPAVYTMRRLHHTPSRRIFLLLAGATVPLLPASAAVRGDEVMYVGGTFSQIPDKTEGKLDLTPSTAAVFTSKASEIKIPFKSITSLEYGQKAGRRVGVALVVNPLFLLSKKRKHYLSVGFADESGNKQGIVFELSKGKTRSVITTLETKSGKTVEFESEDAKKHYGN